MCGLTLLTTAGDGLLPSLFLDGTHFSPAADHVFIFMLLICGFAFFAVWSQRRSVLDYWLIIVALALVCEVALSLAGAARFSVGFYANRTFSLITSATILVLLLAETTKLYARLARSNMMLQHERSNKLMNMEAMVASISHEVRQPLTSIVANSTPRVDFSVARPRISTKCDRRWIESKATAIAPARYSTAFVPCLDEPPRERRQSM